MRGLFSGAVALEIVRPSRYNSVMPLSGFDLMIAVYLLLRVGQVCLIGGTVRSKNAAGVAVRLLVDLAVVVLFIWCVSGLFLPLPGQPPRWLHVAGMFSMDDSRRSSGLIGLLAPAMIIGGAIVGSTAERAKLPAVLITGLLLSALLLPILFNLTFVWQSLFIHRLPINTLAVLVAGSAAVTAAAVLGPRRGKYNRDLSVNNIPGHNVLLQLVGLILLILAFSTLSSNAFNALLCASAALLTATLFGHFRFGKIDIGLLTAGTIGGLCGGLCLSNSAGGLVYILTGLVAGGIIPPLVLRLEITHRIDDVSGTGVSHLGGGLIGLIMAAVLDRTGRSSLVHAGLGDLAISIVAIATSAGVTYGVLKLFARFGQLRLSESAEFEGTDLTETDLNAYPDFQQTMIKSHHLREL